MGAASKYYRHKETTIFQLYFAHNCKIVGSYITHIGINGHISCRCHAEKRIPIKSLIKATPQMGKRFSLIKMMQYSIQSYFTTGGATTFREIPSAFLNNDASGHRKRRRNHWWPTKSCTKHFSHYSQYCPWWRPGFIRAQIIQYV